MTDLKERGRDRRTIITLVGAILIVVMLVAIVLRGGKTRKEEVRVQAAEQEVLSTLQASFTGEGTVNFYPDLKSYEIAFVEDSLTADLLKLGLVLDYNNTTREWDNLVASYLGLYNSFKFTELNEFLADYSLKLKDFSGTSLLEIKDGRVTYDILRDIR